MAKIAAVILLVSLLNISAFFDKHGIDLTDILLHLANHPFVALKMLLKVALKVMLKAILKTTILING